MPGRNSPGRRKALLERASEQTGTLLPREKNKKAYNKALLERYKHLPEVKRITRHRHLPKGIYKTAKLHRQIVNADKRKEKNVLTHSRPGSVKWRSRWRR